MSSIPNTAQGIATNLYGGFENVLSLKGHPDQMAFVNPATNSDIISFDAVITESHQRESAATAFPIEDGSNITDHIFVSPFELSIQGIVTDTPLGFRDGFLDTAIAVGVSALAPPLGIAAAGIGQAVYSQSIEYKKRQLAQAAGVAYTRNTRSNEAFSRLLLMQAGAPDISPPIPPAIFNVRSKLRLYPSMCIRSLSVQRDATISGAIIFQATLTQLRIVRPQSVNVQLLQNKALGASKASEGDKATTPAAFQKFQEGRLSFDNLIGREAQ